MGRKVTNQELGRKSVEEFKSSKKSPIILVLDNVRSLHNIGSIFRTADGFSVKAIYLCGITARPPHREITKTALGATDSVEWKYFESTLAAVKELKTSGVKVYSIEQAEDRVWLQDVRVEKETQYALVFGHEVKGVSQEVIDACDGVIEIPQTGTKHSFNLSISVGMVLWEFCREHM